MVNSREKGKRGERQAASALTDVFGLPFRRTQQYCGASTDSDDVRPDGIELRIAWEVKYCARLNLFDALSKCEQDAAPGAKPVLLHRRNGRDWLWVAYLRDMPHHIRELHSFVKV